MQDNFLLNKAAFSDSFAWGVATAAYQIEGNNKGGMKGDSIWDTFVRKKRKIFQGHDGSITCDFYNRYAKDISLMARLNIPNFRFSISWSRIFNEGRGDLNTHGIDFYNRVIDYCLELNITPWVTLYHWDLPQALQEKGGWVNRDIVEWFTDYTASCIKTFGDRVHHWMVLNEPLVFTGAGYFYGVHAPGKKGLGNFLAAAHHAALCQAAGARTIKSLHDKAVVGTTFSTSYVQPVDDSSLKHVAAASRVDALLNRLFLEPLLGLGYPKEIKLLRRIEKYMKGDDEKNLAFHMDFIGVQNYTREIVSHTAFVPFMKAKIVSPQKRKVEATLMNWEVYPEAIYQVLKKFSKYENIPPLVITENGAAFQDELINNEVPDHKRVQFLQDNLKQVLRAKDEGVNVSGYFVWTLLDNFEWAAGYHPRFGLVYVDFKTQVRTIKASGYWYSKFLQNKNQVMQKI